MPCVAMSFMHGESHCRILMQDVEARCQSKFIQHAAPHQGISEGEDELLSLPLLSHIFIYHSTEGGQLQRVSSDSLFVQWHTFVLMNRYGYLRFFRKNTVQSAIR